MATKRDLAGMEARRLRGARLLKRGVAQAEVAREVGVSRQSVSTWSKQLTAVNGAVGKLKAKPLGRPRRLEAKHAVALRAMLLKGALAYGFPTELWTIKRVRALVKREFGMAYSHTGCWRLLRALGFTPQKPERRAIQRDERAIAHWKKKRWPALKKTPGAKGAPSSS